MQKKCYFGCHLNGPLHSFPSPVYPHEERFDKWKSVLSKELISRGNSYIHGNVRLCGRHFEQMYKTRGNRLTANSIPTLYLSPDTEGEDPVLLQPIFAIASTSSSSIEQAPMPVSASCPLLQDTTTTSAQAQITCDFLADRAIKIIGRKHKAIEQAPMPVSASCPLLQDTTTTSAQAQITCDFLADRAIKIIGRKHKVLSSENIKQSKESLKLKKKLLEARAKSKSLKQLIQKAERISKYKSFLKTIEKLPEPSFLFTKMQRQFEKKSRGRRFTIEEKILALTIYKQSQKAYNLMRRLFVLPSKRTIQKVLNVISLKPGINNIIFKNLKDTVKKLPEEKKLCTLLFDEVALSPGLFYSNHNDQIVGFEDFGDHKTTKIADHALVFMLKSIKGKYKQPICFTFCQSSTKKDQLKCLIKDVIRQVNSTGLKIVATICDQGGPNMSAIKSLIAETKAKYLQKNLEHRSLSFEVDEIKVFPIFDPPHLLKGIRNNFIDNEVKFILNGEDKIAKWEHLKMLLNIDVGDDDNRLLNMLTELHVNKEKMPKMKVKYAAQVFSQRVSGTLRFLAKHNVLPKECEATSQFLLIMDKLFDSFNGHSYQESAKKYRSCLKKYSIHHNLWDELLPVLRSIQFKKIVKRRDGSEETTYVQVPSLKNWINNINVFKEMFKYLNEEHEITSLLTRNFNQDPLENFFSNIRSNGVRNISPTCNQFISAFKTLLINNFSSVHAVGANCEKDSNKPLQSLKHLLTCSNKTQIGQETPSGSQHFDIDPLLGVLRDEQSNFSFLGEESKRYVGGYIIKKCKKYICKNCKTCNKSMSTIIINEKSLTYERDITKKSLNYPSDEMHKYLSEIFKITNKTVSSNPQQNNIKENIKMMVNTLCNTNFINCSKHRVNVLNFCTNLAININIHSWCTCVNRILCGKIKNFDRKDIIKLQAERYNAVHRNKK